MSHPQELFVREAGSREAPAILLLHGSPLSSRMWQPQFERLQDFHLIAPDLPGHGQSASVPLTTLPKLASRVAELIRNRTAGSKAHMVGLSFGGVVAQGLMARFPELVDHVILTGTAVRLPGWLVASSKLNEPLLRVLNPGQLAWLVSLQFGIPRQYLQSMQDDFKAFSSKTILNVLETYRDIPMPSATASPTLVCVGQKETIAAKWSARRLAKGIPGARGVLVPGAGHVWNLEKPDLFCDTVRAWVTDQPFPAELQPLQ